MCLAVDADEYLIKMPAPPRIGSTMNTAFPDLRSKQWAKAVPPVPHGLMADADAALEQEIFDLPQRQGVTDIQHHRAADYLRRTVEITERILHRRRLRDLTFQLKPIYSDNALADVPEPIKVDRLVGRLARLAYASPTSIPSSASTLSAIRNASTPAGAPQ